VVDELVERDEPEERWVEMRKDVVERLRGLL